MPNRDGFVPDASARCGKAVKRERARSRGRGDGRPAADADSTGRGARRALAMTVIVGAVAVDGPHDRPAWAGTIKGHVRFTGSATEQKTLPVTTDQYVCGKEKDAEDLSSPRTRAFAMPSCGSNQHRPGRRGRPLRRRFPSKRSSALSLHA